MSGGKLAAHPRIPGTTAIGPTEQLIGKRNDDVFHRYPVAPFGRNTVDPVISTGQLPVDGAGCVGVIPETDRQQTPFPEISSVVKGP